MFRLTPKTTFPEDLAKVEWSLAIAAPTADRALDTNRVAVVSQATQIDYVASAIWADRAPTMIQGLTVASFRASRAIKAVGTTREQQRPNFMLRPSLRAFQIQQTGAEPTVRVGIDTDLVTMPDRAVVDQSSFTEEASAAANTLDDIVNAFDDALGKVLKQLVLWTLQSGETAASGS